MVEDTQTAFDRLPTIGEPGTAPPFLLQRLRDWGLDDLATECVTREQALLAHHCALVVRMVWQDMEGAASEPPMPAIRHCVAALIDRPGMPERAEQAFQANVDAQTSVPDLHADPELYDGVASALRHFA